MTTKFDSEIYYLLVEIFEDKPLDKYIALMIENYIYAYEEQTTKERDYNAPASHRKYNIFTKRFRTKFGVRDGEYKKWLNGKLVEERMYKEGKLDGEVIKYQVINDNKSKHMFYKEGKLHGPYKEWFFHGKLYKSCTFKDGQLHGEYEEYYNKVNGGNLHLQCVYEHDELQGEYFNWYKSGQCKLHCVFHKGKYIENQTEMWTEDGVKTTQKECLSTLHAHLHSLHAHKLLIYI